MSLVVVTVRVRDNTDEGFARIRTAARNMRRSLNDNFGAAGRASGQSFGTRFANMASQLFATSRQMGSGLLQGIGGALKSGGSSPYVMAGIAVLVASVASAIGAALAGAIVLAFGGAFVGLGVYLLKDLPEVKSAWEKATNGLKKQFTEAAKPLLPVIQRAITRMGQLADKFAPHFKKAMEDAAPHLKSFLDRTAKGIEKFGKTAFKPMMDAFNDLLDNIDMESFFSSLGDSFKYLAEAVSDNKKEIGLLFNIILGTIPVAIRIIGFLARTWGDQVRQVKAIAASVMVAVGWIKKMTGKTVRFGQKGLETVTRWLRTARDWVNRLKGKTISIVQRGAEKVTSAVRTARQWISNLKGKTVSILQRGAGGVVSAVQGAINTIRRLVGKTVSVGVRGASAAVAAVQRVINRIRNFVGKTVSIGVNFFKGAGSKLASALGFAHGGIVGAAGGGPRSNMTLVGEQGPELVDLAPGSRVRTNSDTRRILSSGGGGGQPMVVILQIGDKQLGELMIDPVRKVIRTRGGNVQAVLGS